MTGTAAASTAALAGYLELAAGGEADRKLAQSLLDGLGRQTGARAAAAYLKEDGTLVRELSTGAGSFPYRIAEDEASRFERRPMAGGELLLDGGTIQEERDTPVLLALAAAVRALVLEKKLKRQRFEVNYRGVELEALYDVGLAIASTLNLEQLSEEILLRAVSLLDARRGALYAADRDGGYRLSRILGGEARQRLAPDDPQVAALLQGRTPPAPQDLMPGAEHLLAVAIEVDGDPRGLLVVGDKESRRGVGPFGASDRRTLSLFANQAAIALENANLHRQALEKERLLREIELAAEIQRRLLPARLPRVEGVELSGWNRSARHVGGDYYDVLELPGGRLAPLVADVSGKGMPAALMVSTLYSALHLLLDGREPGPDLVERLNGHIFQSSAPNKFITLLVTDVHPVSGEVRYVNAGHNPGIVLRAGGEVEELPPGGMPLGFFRDGRYTGGELALAPGDLLCLFSDGITEAAAADDEEFGAGRLVDLLRRSAELPLPEIIEIVDGEVTRFADGAPQADDQTLVLVRKR
ncbi:MAG: SpoIIE family protein phosphatase [Thermoanaerobaculia bacterium]|nr:SpoIIE family protein phosphatase [Thermoanaerobaculia bacterium]